MAGGRNRSGSTTGGAEDDFSNFIKTHRQDMENLKADLARKIDESMSRFDDLVIEITKLKEQGQRREAKIARLEEDVAEIKMKAKSHEEKANEFEQAIRNNNVVLKGVKIRTLADVVEHSTNKDGSIIDGRSNINRGQATVNKVVAFANEHAVAICQEDIKSVSAFSRKERNGRGMEMTIIRFKDEQAKRKFLEIKKRLRENRTAGIFINDDLTALNANLAYKGRALKKDGKIEDTWTHEGRIYIKKLATQGGQITQIKSVEQLVQFN